MNKKQNNTLSIAWLKHPSQYIALALLASFILLSPIQSHADGTQASSGTYAGVFVGSARIDNRFLDIKGFANWGNPGWTVDYNESKTVSGILIGRQIELGDTPVKIEWDGTFGNISASSSDPDPVGQDETVISEFHWTTSLRARVDKTVGPVTLFVSAGLAAARITNSITDIDYSCTRNPDSSCIEGTIVAEKDPDDSFLSRSLKIGWVAGVGIESPLNDLWRIRLEGSIMDFGQKTHEVNRSGNGRCGRGGSFTPCPYRIDNRAGIVRLAIIRHFGP